MDGNNHFLIEFLNDRDSWPVTETVIYFSKLFDGLNLFIIHSSFGRFFVESDGFKLIFHGQKLKSDQ